MSIEIVFHPKPVTVADLAFGGQKHLLPPDVPKEFYNGHTHGNKFFADMFYCGLKNIALVPQDGVDPKSAFAHIRAIAGSWELKHEVKEAAIAYLFTIWFKPVSKWETAGK